ncbi:hypothetical protein CNMCM5793_008208 [Aspergillus hiratsukae]|uniref:Nephrocystin 3-like N-terminal domain-containing protein n=1 Tax=Aspergillus hiratsukae TaxID=1194566 RepID=A0A8H6P822_9EURO|nr:hypothetical protein CNMCM5793_008208 [Aspergillus hiratsukae]KAF7163693.1 hypothetical protein CNMCM6106_000509 [Aspergillus hiratsukae]
MSVLSIGPGASVAVHSLAINPVQRNSKVATLSFHTLPVSLSEGSKDQWKFALPPDGDEDAVNTTHTLILDTHFSGFTPLQHSEEDNCDVDVIAISGLGGHAFGSFKERSGHFMWLRDALPLDFPNARILIYGYDTGLVRSSSFQNLTDLGRGLQADMKSIRVISPCITRLKFAPYGLYSGQEPNQSRPILFIGHSLGGLVIKEAMCKLKDEMDEVGASILNYTCGFLFFGVPHQGMAIESLVPLVKDQPNRGLLESLGKNSALLVRLDEDFRVAFSRRHIPITAFYETEKSLTAVKRNGRWELSGPLKVLVDVSSATCGSKNQHPIDRSHSEMVKYSDQYDALYQRAKTALRPLLLKARSMRNSMSVEPGNNSLLPHSTKSLVNTCAWLLDDPQYKAWMNKPRGLFWLKGNPGAGKSVLMKFAAQEMANRKCGELVVSYFLHGRGTVLQKTPLGVFRALLNGMLKSFPAYLSELTSQFDDREKRFGSYEEGRWTWAEKELQDFLFRVLTKGTKAHPIVIFVDALDEAGKDAGRALLTYFRDIMKEIEREEGQVKICVSSRHHPNLGLNMCPTISVEERNDQDIRLVIRGRLEKIQPDSKRQQIEKEILLKAQGGFQWAVLVCNMVIEENDNGTKAEKLLENLLTIPEALDELYADILGDVTESERHQTVKLFQWVLFTARPLSAQELRDALSIDMDMQRNTKIRKHASWSDTLPEFERHVRHLSRGLVQFQPRDNIWERYRPGGEDSGREAQFIHQSVADYLLKNFLSRGGHDRNGSQSPIAAGLFQISRSCLRYLRLEEVLEEARRRPGKLRTSFQLVPYALRFLSHHIRKVEQLGITQSDLPFLVQLDRQSDMQRIGSVWRVWGYSGFYVPINWPFIEATALHVLVALGSKTAFDEFLKKDNVQVDGRDAEGNTPLLLAIREGHQDMAVALLNRSIKWRLRQNECVEQSINGTRAREQERSYLVDVYAENTDGETPLALAIRHNSGEVIYKLLEAGAELDDEDIILASRSGKTAIVSLLLSRGASATSRNRYGQFPLLIAVEERYREVVEILLRKEPAAVEMEANDGQRVLDTAIYRDEIEIARLLIKEGIFRPSSAALAKGLALAIKNDMLDLVEIIIQKDESLVNIDVGSGRTPLSWAAANGCEAIVKLLLKAGATPKTMDGSGGTPLSIAAMIGHQGVVKLLLEAGANPEAMDGFGRTPLLLAVRNGREAVVKLLLKGGAKPKGAVSHFRPS